MSDFKNSILEGIPNDIPNKKEFEPSINHAPKRKDILSLEEKKLAQIRTLKKSLLQKMFV